MTMTKMMMMMMMMCTGDGVGGSGAWWRRRCPVPVTGTDPQAVVVAAINSTPGGPADYGSRSTSNSVTLVLPSTMSRSAGNSPGVTKPAGASPLVPSCRSAFSLTGGGGGAGMAATSPYSDSAAAAVDQQRQKVTSVKQMAQLFDDAAASSSWQRDVRRQHQLAGAGVDVQSRQFTVERRHFAVNSELFFFSTSSTTTTATTTTSTASTSASNISDSRSSTFAQLRPAAPWRKSNTDLRPATSGTTPLLVHCVSEKPEPLLHFQITPTILVQCQQILVSTVR